MYPDEDFSAALLRYIILIIKPLMAYDTERSCCPEIFLREIGASYLYRDPMMTTSPRRAVMRFDSHGERSL